MFRNSMMPFAYALILTGLAVAQTNSPPDPGGEIPEQTRVIGSTVHSENSTVHEHNTLDEGLDHLNELLEHASICPDSENVVQESLQIVRTLREIYECIQVSKALDSFQEIDAFHIDSDVRSLIRSIESIFPSPGDAIYRMLHGSESLSDSPNNISEKIQIVFRSMDLSYRLRHNFGYSVQIENFPDYWARKIFAGRECVQGSASTGAR